MDVEVYASNDDLGDDGSYLMKGMVRIVRPDDEDGGFTGGLAVNLEIPEEFWKEDHVETPYYAYEALLPLSVVKEMVAAYSDAVARWEREEAEHIRGTHELALVLAAPRVPADPLEALYRR